MRAQSVSARLCACAWQAAMAACSPYGPARRRAGRTLQRGQPTADQELVPAIAVLVSEEDRLARTATRARAREAWISMRATRPCASGSLRNARPTCARGARPPGRGRTASIVARGGRIALVEHQVDDLEHRTQTFTELVGGAPGKRHTLWEKDVWHARCAGPRPSRCQEGAGYLLGRETADQPQGQCHPAVAGQDGSAAKIRRSTSSPISSSTGSNSLEGFAGVSGSAAAAHPASTRRRLSYGGNR